MKAASSGRRPTVLYVVSHPIQYQAPLFRWLAGSEALRLVAAFGCEHGIRATFDPGFQQTVHFGVDLLGGYEHLFVPQHASRPDIGRFWGLRLPWLGNPWGPHRPDCLVLHGWRTCMMWQAALWARRQGVPYFVRGENPLFKGDPSRRGLARQLHRAMLRQLLGHAAGVLTLGTANQRYFEACGVASDRMHHMPYFVDVAAVRVAATAGRARRGELRARHGIPADAFVVIAVAKLQPRKRARDLIEALAGLPPDTHVLWVGSGETEPACRELAATLGVADRLHLTGFLSAQETWELLGAADLFAIPSEREKWGLVINEACAAGLPVLATDQCGAAEDLVENGRTGQIVTTGDVAHWRQAIGQWRERLLAGKAWYAERTHQLAEAHSTEAAARALVGVVQGMGTESLPPCLNTEHFSA